MARTLQQITDADRRRCPRNTAIKVDRIATGKIEDHLPCHAWPRPGRGEGRLASAAGDECVLASDRHSR